MRDRAESGTSDHEMDSQLSKTGPSASFGHVCTRLLVVGDALLWAAALIGLIGLMIPALRPALQYPILIVAPLSLLFLVFGLSRMTLYPVLGMVGAGALLSLLVGVSWPETSDALFTMCGIFTFVAVVRLIEIPLLRRHLDVVLAARVSRAKTSGSVLWPGAFLTYVLALVLSFGAIPVAYRSVRHMFGPESSVASSAALVNRAFITANSVTPMSPPMALALSVVGLTWIEFLPLGIVVSVVGVALLALGPKPTGRMVHMPDLPNQGTVREFVGVLAAIIGLVVFFGIVIPGGGIVVSTVLSVLIVVLIWEFLTGGGRKFFPRVLSLAVDERRTWRDQYVLLVASALVVAAALHWGQDTDVLQRVQAAGVPLIVLLALVPPVIAGLSLVGVYPMTSLLLVCAIFPPLGGGTWDIFVVAVAVLGVHIGFLLSPISGLTLLMAAMANVRSTSVGLRWNGIFGIAFLIAATTVIIVIAAFMGI
jgi:hypothetical protein